MNILVNGVSTKSKHGSAVYFFQRTTSFLFVFTVKNHFTRSCAAWKFWYSSGNFLPSVYSLYIHGSPTANTNPWPTFAIAMMLLPSFFNTEVAGGLTFNVLSSFI